MATPTSPNDILTVHNIDVDCFDTQTEYRRKIVSSIDDEGNHVSDSQDIPFSFDHSKGFQTWYEGQVFAIRPGDSRRLPRYVAEKLAKELIDHLLTKKSALLKDPNIVNNVEERTLLLEQIIINEELLIQEDGFVEPMQNLSTTPDPRDSRVLKEGEMEVGDQLRGFETPKQTNQVTLQDIHDAPDTTVQDGEHTRTRSELMAELKTLGLPFQRTDTNQDLLNRLKAF